MAITWGAWEYSGGNGMRVGIEVVWDTPTHSTTVLDADVFVYTENQYTYSDNQTLTYGGSISGTTDFNNSSGGSAVQRANKDYDYTYSGSSYGSSPSTKTFSASLSGAFNGVTPSVSVSSPVPARPYAAPAAPTGATAVRISDTSTKAQWTNNETTGEPYDTQTLQRSTNGGAFSTRSSSISGSATSYTDATVANAKYRYQVRATNTIGSSSYTQTGDIWTTPAQPVITTTLSAGTPDGKRITWANTGMGYSEYSTEIIGYKNGVSVGTLGTVATGGTTFDHTTTNPVSIYTVADRWKYAVRHKTTSGTTLYSAYTGFTDETTGTTSPPAVSTNLSPGGGGVVDPTLQTVLSWTYNATDGSNQSRAQVRYRLAGIGTWTTPADFAQVVANGATGSYTSIPAGTFGDGNTLEWQVATKGADATYGPWSASATFVYTVSVITPDPVLLPVLCDLNTGDLQASYSAYEIRDAIMRAQAKVPGGGVKSVDSSFNISWSSRFTLKSLGRSLSLWPEGYHDILNPYSWTVTNKALTSNVATLTLSASTNRMRVGDKIIVTGVGSPFDGTYTVRDMTSNTVSYDKVNANVTSAAATGTVGCAIQGHGSMTDALPSTTSTVPLSASWAALYYELVPAWGAGTAAKKNGVVSVTNKALTSNVATIQVPKPHYFAIGDSITVSVGDTNIDGTRLVITGLGSVSSTVASITYAKTASNVTSAACTGYAKPSGVNTFFGNFHLVETGAATPDTAFFTVPSNWLKLAMRNADGADSIEWCTGDSDTGWITPTLANSWVAYGGSFEPPAYRKLNGIVYLKGMVKNGTAGASIFTLPAAFRPPANQSLFSVAAGSLTNVTGAASAGTAHTHPITPDNIGVRLDILSTGGVVPTSTAGNSFISMSGISFPADA